MAHMDVAIGVGRAVMQNEALGAGALFAQPVVKAELGPARENRRLLGSETGFHRKVGHRQEHGVSIVGGGCGGVGHGIWALSLVEAREKAPPRRRFVAKAAPFPADRHPELVSV
jgi:hypothetical protein